jgi:uncharacterized protein YjbI with pentapeptide repeats
VPSDVYYATGEIRRLTNAESRSYVEADEGSDVSIDLQSAHLYGVSWKGLDVSWVTFYARFADLRFANLTDSHWGPATLVCADLQHANLTDADLSGADLRGAVLRDADLTGADLTGAMLWGADLTGATITPAQRDSAKSAGLGARPASFGPEPAADCVDRITPG